MPAWDETAPALRRDIDTNSRRLRELEEWRRNVDLLDATGGQRLDAIEKRLGGVESQQHAISNRLLGLALAIGGGSVTILLTVLAGTGKI